MSTWNCPLCDSFAAPAMKQVIRHIGSVHAHHAGFQITCGVGKERIGVASCNLKATTV